MVSGIPNVSTGCIFSLKQLGWKDRHELSGDPNNPLIPRPLRIIVEYVKAGDQK
jgi:hypothetical protein